MLERKQYYALPEGDSTSDLLDDEATDDQRWDNGSNERGLLKVSKSSHIMLTVSGICNVILVPLCVYLAVRTHIFSNPANSELNQVYSPAQDAVSYIKHIFVDGLHQSPDSPSRPIYLGPPTDETDQAWQELYNIGGISQISSAEAESLSETTAKVLDEPDGYFIGLDVFHQLHCLNWVRKALRPERYTVFSLEGLSKAQIEERMVHIDHCIDSIRQSLMCSADISPVIWHWKTTEGLVQDMNNTHTCRDFEKIKDWAKAHMLTREINSKLPRDERNGMR